MLPKVLKKESVDIFLSYCITVATCDDFWNVAYVYEACFQHKHFYVRRFVVYTNKTIYSITYCLCMKKLFQLSGQMWKLYDHQNFVKSTVFKQFNLPITFQLTDDFTEMINIVFRHTVVAGTLYH